MYKTKYLTAPGVISSAFPYKSQLKEIDQLVEGALNAEELFCGIYGVNQGLNELERFAEEQRRIKNANYTKTP